MSTLRTPLAPRDRVQLWIGGQPFDVHGVVMRGDSVLAVRFFQPTSCEGCALHFALRDIDSLQVQAFRTGASGGIGWSPVVGGLLVLAVGVLAVWALGGFAFVPMP